MAQFLTLCPGQMTMDVTPSRTEDESKLPFTKKLASVDRMNSGSTWAGNTPVSDALLQRVGTAEGTRRNP
eukprot:s1156_g21.t1